MPTPDGKETIGERLTRLREELARVRQAIARAVDNGQSFAMGGVTVTAIALDQLHSREARIVAEIRSLEARLAGGSDRGNVAVTVTRMD
jgi:hypothetical protein